MTIRQSERKSPTGNHENCITVEHDRVKRSAKTLVKDKNERDKGKQFERIPIFRGFIIREIKPIEE